MAGRDATVTLGEALAEAARDAMSGGRPTRAAGPKRTLRDAREVWQLRQLVAVLTAVIGLELELRRQLEGDI